MDNPNRNEKFVQTIQHDPKLFVDQILGCNLWQRQTDIIESVAKNRRTTVRSSHGIGKSYIAARTALWFLYSHPDSKVITTAPSFRQVEDILWREMRVAHAKSKYDLGGKMLQTTLNLDNDWFALGLSTDQPDRFQGFHAVDILLIIDEAAGVKEDIFNASEGIVSSDHSRVLYIGNPTNLSGAFYNSFKLENWNKIHISAFDTPNFTTFGITLDDIRSNTWLPKITSELPAPYLVSPEWVYDKYLSWGEGNPMWESRVLGNFPQQGEDTLIPLIKIEEAITRQIENKPEDIEVIGVDVARFGSDKTIFVYRKGTKVLDMKEFSHMDLMSTAQALNTYIGMHPMASVNIDEIGLGAGLVDRIKQMNPMKNIQGVNVGNPSKNNEMFINIRAESYWALRDRFVNGDIQLPNDEQLMAELASIKYKFTPRGQIQIESKDDMKKRGMHSPDKSDALMLSFMVEKRKPNILQYIETLK